MGMGYLAAINLGSYSSSDVGLDVIVKNLEQRRAAASATSTTMESVGPMNTVNHQQREAAALLRGDASSGVRAAANNHRRASSGVESGDDADAVVTSMPDILPAAGKKDSHNTFREMEGEDDEDLSVAQKRFVETQKLLSTQSIPTPTNPHVMKTVGRFRSPLCCQLFDSIPRIRLNLASRPIQCQPNLPDSKRKKILITGGAGFVGSHLTDKLMMEGHEVIVVDNFFTGQRKNVEHWMHHPRFQLVVHDVTEPIMLEVDEIYHLACPASPPHYQYNPVKTIKVRIAYLIMMPSSLVLRPRSSFIFISCIKTSTMGTINMLGLAYRIKAKILLTSTSEIYGDPQVHPQPVRYCFF
jgi:hypothetical protein